MLPREWHAGSGLAWATVYLAVCFVFPPIQMGGVSGRWTGRLPQWVFWPTQTQTEQAEQ